MNIRHVEVSQVSAEQQLKFLKQIQQILQLGSFSSSYKFALLISLSRLAIEQGQDTGAALELSYLDIAEKFVELYWNQSLPYTLNQSEQSDSSMILNQNNGVQAAIVNRVIAARKKYTTIPTLRRDDKAWKTLLSQVAKTVKIMPVQYLQNIQGESHEFLYHLDQCSHKLLLLPKMMFCLRQFSEIIEELCQKKWIDYILLNKNNLLISNGLPNLAVFMFETSRDQLSKAMPILVELQQGQCFYCGQWVTPKQRTVDHFIPWSMYSYDTGHNFVMADARCNSKKSNMLASPFYLAQWQARNHLHDQVLQTEMAAQGFLSDINRSHAVAAWAYQQASDNDYLFWEEHSENIALIEPV